MQFDRAISFLLEGHTIQRVAWVEPENKRIENVGGSFCFAGHEDSFGRQIPYTRRVSILADDIAADDWQIVHHYYDGDKVETPSPQPNLRASCAGIADDYMTSETHHPGWVLIPQAKFDAIRAALSAEGSTDA